MSIRVTRKLFDSFITELLHKMRPDRYDVDEGVDTEWLDEVAKEVIKKAKPQLNLEEILFSYVRGLVGDWEAKATQAGMSVCRKIYQDHKAGRENLPGYNQWLISTIEEPIKVVIRTPTNDGFKNVLTRVKLRSASPDDLRLFANQERRAAVREQQARFESCEGAELMADQIEAGGFNNYGEWVNSLIPERPNDDDPLGEARS